MIEPGGVAQRVSAARRRDADELLAPVKHGLSQVPPLPHVVRELLIELSHPESTARTVARIAASDPALAAALIRTVNAAAFGLRRKVSSVAEAVNFLGYSVVRSLVVRMRLDQVLPRRTARAGYDAEDLWVHSLAVSHAAECIAERVTGVERAFVSTLGLLHDIGKLAINSYFPASAQRLHDRNPDRPDESFLDRERRLFGGDHAEIGAILAAHWKLPADLVEAIRWHHDPKNVPGALPPSVRRAAGVVHLANQLAKYCYVYSDDVEIDIIHDALFEELGLAGPVTRLLTRKVREAVSRAIFFADEGSSRPLDTIRRFVRLSTPAEAAKVLANPAPFGSRVEIAEGGELGRLFSTGRRHVNGVRMPAEPRDRDAHVRFSGWSTPVGLKFLAAAVIEHQDALPLDESTRLPARFIARRLLANLATPSDAPAAVDVAQCLSAGRLWLAVRSPALAFHRRFGPDASTVAACRVLDRELANVLNLRWFHQVLTNEAGDTLLFTGHEPRR